MASTATSRAVAVSDTAATDPPTPVNLLADASEWADAAVARDVDIDDDEEGGGSGGQAAAADSRDVTFVKELDELSSLLLALPYSDATAPRIGSILDQYQEACELLDPHMPHMVARLINYVHDIIRPGKKTDVPPIDPKNPTATPPPTAPTGRPCSGDELLSRVFKVIYYLCKVRGYKAVSHFFPHEVADLEPTLQLLQAEDPKQPERWEVRYGLLMWLSVIVLIPFDLNTVDSTIAAHDTVAPKATSASATPADMDDGAFESIDSSGGLISSLISLGCSYLSDTGPPRDAAGVMLSKLFSRPDMHASHLSSFFRWATRRLTRIEEDRLAQRGAAGNVFTATGILKALCEIFRYAPRDVLLKHVNLVFHPLIEAQSSNWTSSTNSLSRKLFVKLSQRVGLTFLPARVAKWRYQRGHRSLDVMLQQHVNRGTNEAGSASNSQSDSTMLGSKPESAQPQHDEEEEEDEGDDDVPESIESIIQILLDGLRDRDTIVRWSAAKGIGRLTNCLSKSFGDDVVESVVELLSGREGDGAWHGGCLALAELARRGLLLPSRLSQVVPITLRALVYDRRTATHSVGAHVRDASCYVIWAFARAYAPAVMAPYMRSLAQGLLTLTVFDREVNVRRAASAAFQEHVGRQGSASFEHGMEILQLADYFTISNRTHAYQVVAWQVAEYEEYALHLIQHLLTYKVNHWEKEMRLLTASALGILTNRSEETRRFMRHTALDSLVNVAKTSKDLVEKHGAVVALATILRALYSKQPDESKDDFLSEQQKTDVCALVGSLTEGPSSSMLNGRGGQIMREAICILIGAIADTSLLLSTPSVSLSLIRSFQRLLDENVAHTNEEVSNAAVEALECFMRKHYLPVATDEEWVKQEKLSRAKPVLENYTRTLIHPSTLPGTARGFAAVLGRVPVELLTTNSVQARPVYAAKQTSSNSAASSSAPSSSSSASSTAASNSASSTTSSSPVAPLPPANARILQPLSRVLHALIVSSHQLSQPDAETRRNAIISLTQLMGKLNGEQLAQYMTPMPPPPTPRTVVNNATSSSSSSSSSTSSTLNNRDKAVRAAQESFNKFQRDLASLGIPGNRIVDRVVTALLLAMEDYQADNRGDVGSWVREAAMIGLEKLVCKLANISAAIQQQPQNESPSTNEEEQPSPPLLTPDLSRKVMNALLKQSVEKIDRIRECAGRICQHLLWAGEHCTDTDTNSEQEQAAVPHIPQRDELRKHIPPPTSTPGASKQKKRVAKSESEQAQEIDWSSPAQTFPLILPLMAIQEERRADAAAATTSSSSQSDSSCFCCPFHHSILSGLVISVGGLSESVVKHSSDALVAYVSDLCEQIAEGEDDGASRAQCALQTLKVLASDFLSILLEEKGHARVIVPTLKTLELLLSQNLFEPLTPEVSSFASDLQSRIWKEVGHSQNIHKLLAAVPVLVALLSFDSLEVRRRTLQNLLQLLSHASFPRLRRCVAESMYNALLISGDEIIPHADTDTHSERSQKVLDILTNTAWDGAVSVARAERDKLFELLEVPKPKLKTKAPTGSAGAANANGTTSSSSSAIHNTNAAPTTRSAQSGSEVTVLSDEYSALVQSMGY